MTNVRFLDDNDVCELVGDDKCIEEVDIGFVPEMLESVQLSLKENIYNEGEGRMLWTIEVRKKSKKPYTIERAFNEFEWVVTVYAP